MPTYTSPTRDCTLRILNYKPSTFSPKPQTSNPKSCSWCTSLGAHPPASKLGVLGCAPAVRSIHVVIRNIALRETAGTVPTQERNTKVVRQPHKHLRLGAVHGSTWEDDSKVPHPLTQSVGLPSLSDFGKQWSPSCLPNCRGGVPGGEPSGAGLRPNSPGCDEGSSRKTAHVGAGVGAPCMAMQPSGSRVQTGQ